jgi:hypothetical protein
MRKVLLGAMALATSMLAASPALAETSTWQKVFEVDGPSKSGSAEVAQVQQRCNFRMMSRMGPDPKEVAACDAAVKQLARRGDAAVPAILTALDAESTSYTSRDRLYAALAESKDPAVAAKMIDAMAKVATGRVEDRTYEAQQMEEVARSILHTNPGERAPWVEEAKRDPYERLTERVVGWRVLQRETAGKTADELAGARLSDARSHKSDRDIERAYLSVRYLMTREPAEARTAAEELLARLPPPAFGVKDELATVRRHLESLRRTAEFHEREAASEARAKAARGPLQVKAPPPVKKQPPAQAVNDSKSRS